MKKEKITIFTDGASSGNPGPGGWGAVIVADKGAEKKVFELGGAEAHTTNNREEISAVLGAFSFVSKNLKLKNHEVIVYSDSSYVVNGITKWIHAWKKRGWLAKTKKEVQSVDLWKKLAEIVEKVEAEIGKEIKWKILSGHVGVVGNERVDKIATDFGAGRKPALFSGELKDYKIDILNVAHDARKKTAKKTASAHSRAKAFSYVSMVKGEIKTHATWAECEKRVKGVSGAKFKKAVSEGDEERITREWRIIQS